MADMKITEYNSHNAPATGDQFFMIGTSEEYRIDYDALASAILDKLTTKTYSGISNNVIDAIAALNSRTDEAHNVRIMTSTNGSFASLCKADGTYAVYANDANGKYCYGQFTIKVGTSYKWVTVSNDTIRVDASNNQGTIVFTGGTAPYTVKVVRQTYTPSNATVEELKSRIDSVFMSTAGTYTKTLDSQAIYLITVGRLNTTDEAYNGMYLVTAHRLASSIRTIAESAGVGSITIETNTLSITTNAPYIIASITRLALIL